MIYAVVYQEKVRLEDAIGFQEIPFEISDGH